MELTEPPSIPRRFAAGLDGEPAPHRHEATFKVITEISIMNMLLKISFGGQMKVKRIVLALICMLIILRFSGSAIAEIKTFVREYTYQASEADSKLSCRAIVLEQIKRLLLEELGIYLESYTDVRNYQLTRDQIITLTAGIVQANIIQEKWDGEKYWVKARIIADPDQVAESINNLRKDYQKTKDLEMARRRAKEAMREVERLKKELMVAKTDLHKLKQYNKAIRQLSATDWYEKGRSYAFKNTKKAIEAYTRAIELSPEFTEAYYGRALQLFPRKVGLATKDLEKTVELDPKHTGAFYLLGICYDTQEEYQKAIFSFSKSIETNIDPNLLYLYYSSRGESYFELGEYELALYDLNESFKLYPPTKPYWLRYRYRGLCYIMLGKTEKGFEDLKRAAQWGDEWCQDFLLEKEISW